MSTYHEKPAADATGFSFSIKIKRLFVLRNPINLVTVKRLIKDEFVNYFFIDLNN